MAFCIQCGQPTHITIPTGDSRERKVCTDCSHIHYVNPNVICGALVTHNPNDGSGEKVLLCRRAIQPRQGYWTLPAGFMEIGETSEQGALRETKEEAMAVAENPELYCIYDIPTIGQVYMMYKASLKNGHYGVGEESLECALFDEADIPWGDMAFYSTVLTLRHYFVDRKKGKYPIHHEVINRRDSDV